MIVEKRPLERVFVHFVSKTSFNSLLDMVSMGVPPGGVTTPIWCIGKFAFVYSQLPWLEPVVREYISGNLHVDTLIYAPHEWDAKEKASYENTVSKVRTPLLNGANNELAAALYGWIVAQEK